MYQIVTIGHDHELVVLADCNKTLRKTRTWLNL
jgi:hypothetical protein